MLSPSAHAVFLVSSLLAFLLSTPASAQRSGAGRGGDELASVELGREAPDVKIYDAQGKLHAIRDLLKGHTTAIVFGCLT